MGPRHDLSFCTSATAWLAPELLGSMSSSPHLWFCAFKTATLWSQLLVSMGPRPHLWFSACKTACLASKLLVSMDPSPHLWFLHAKQRLRTRIASLYVSQISPAVLCLQCSVISTRTTCLYGSQPFSVVFEFKTAPFGAELQVCMGPRPHLSFCPCKPVWVAPSLNGSQT